MKFQWNLNNVGRHITGNAFERCLICAHAENTKNFECMHSLQDELNKQKKETRETWKRSKALETINICLDVVDGFHCKVNLKLRPRVFAAKWERKSIKIMRRDRRSLNYGVTMTLQWVIQERNHSTHTHLQRQQQFCGVNFIDVCITPSNLWSLLNLKTFRHSFKTPKRNSTNMKM